jgi:hypothetical protein
VDKKNKFKKSKIKTWNYQVEISMNEIDDFKDFITKEFLSIKTELNLLKNTIKGSDSSITSSVRTSTVTEAVHVKKEISKKEFEDLVVNNLNDNVLYDLLETNCEKFYTIRNDVLIVAWCSSNNQILLPKPPTDHLFNMRSCSDKSTMLEVKVSSETFIPLEKMKDSIFVLHGMLLKRDKRVLDYTVTEKDKDSFNTILRKGFLEFIGSAWDALKFKYHGKVIFHFSCSLFNLYIISQEDESCCKVIGMTPERPVELFSHHLHRFLSFGVGSIEFKERGLVIILITYKGN